VSDANVVGVQDEQLGVAGMPEPLGDRAALRVQRRRAEQIARVDQII